MKKPVLIKQIGRNRNGVLEYLYQCYCGNVFTCRKATINNGNTKSCGCLKVERASKLNYKHNGKKDNYHLYAVWQAMKSRCNNKKNWRYPRYGGRGISVCKSWENFISFRNWALNNGYQKGLSLEREKNDKGYSPSNCKFILKGEQSRNRECAVGIEIALQIREDSKNGMRPKDIIIKYNIPRGVVYNITSNRTYKVA